MSAASGFDFTQFMAWYRQAGTPRVTAQGSYDAAAKRYTLTLSGGLSASAPFTAPTDLDLHVLSPLPTTDYVASSDQGGQVAEAIVFTPTVSGQYFVLVYGYYAPGPAAPYRLEVVGPP